MKRIVLGMTGATGAVLGIELLRQLQGCADVETHLVLSRSWANDSTSSADNSVSR
jgi:flavin prenyltransferase